MTGPRALPPGRERTWGDLGRAGKAMVLACAVATIMIVWRLLTAAT